MSVYLTIEWPTGDEPLQLGTYREVNEGWTPLARELRLDQMADLANFLLIEPGNVDQVLAEVKMFRSFAATNWADAEGTLDSLQRLIDALETLKRSTGWRATIG